MNIIRFRACVWSWIDIIYRQNIKNTIKENIMKSKHEESTFMTILFLIAAVLAIVIAIGQISYSFSDESDVITEHGVCTIQDKYSRKHGSSSSHNRKYYIETDCGKFSVKRKQYRDLEENTKFNITTKGTHNTGLIRTYPKVVSYHKQT